MHGLIISLALLLLFSVPTARAEDAGNYTGELVLKPNGDGTNMTLTVPFGYVDHTGRKWEVPAGSSTDGASIPRVLWSLVGSPFTGKYLSAAVVHDHFCRTKYRSWMDTHDIFYEAMITSGVSKDQALLMWAAVYRFGPRWTKDQSVCWGMCAGNGVFLQNVRITPEFVQADFEKIRKKIEIDPSVSQQELKRLIDEDLERAESPATWSGYVSAPAEEDPKPNDGVREYVRGEAPSNWPRYGTANIRHPIYKVVSVRSDDKLNMRSGAGSNYPIKFSIPFNASGVSLVGDCDTRWCQVSYNGQIGWVDTTFLALDWKNSPRN